MPTFTLYVALRAEQPLDDDALDALARVAALDLGHDLAAEAVDASWFPLAAEEVSAMDEEQRLVWRAKP